MVKLGTLHFGILGSGPRRGPTPLVSGHAMAATHKKNRGKLAQMLAQGESFSTKMRKKKKKGRKK